MLESGLKPRLVFSFILLTLTFLFYSTAVSDWGHNADDYAAVHMGQVDSIKDLKLYFSTFSNDYGALPSNFRNKKEWGFFDVTYRPLTMVCIYALETYCFGPFAPYKMFLVAAGLHSIAVVLAFNIFLFIVPLIPAFCGAMFFAFHASLAPWIGAISEHVFLLLSIIFMLSALMLLLYFKTKSGAFYLAALALAAISLFFHELSVGFIFWILLAIWFYLFFYSREKWWFLKGIYIWTPYFCSMIGYFFCRLKNYPILSSECSVFNPFDLVEKIIIKIKSLDFITMLVDALGLSWLPSGQMKIFSFFIFASGALILFLLSSKKKEVVLLLIGAGSVSWPSFILLHQGRYIYAALPFFIMAFLVCLNGVLRLRWLAVSTCLAFTVAGAVHNRNSLKERAEKLLKVKEIYKELSKRSELKNRSLCFLGVPWPWIDEHGTAQIIWLHRGSSDITVYIDQQCCACPLTPPGKRDWPLMPKGNLMSVKRDKNSFRFVSLDNSKVWFPNQSGQTSLGTKVINEEGITVFGNRVYDFSITIDEKWLRSDPVFLTWNFENGKIEEIG
jgi:hypothetical protein